MAYNYGMHAELRKAAREARGLTLKQLAASVGLSEGQVSRIERHGTTSLLTALKVADELRLPVTSLVPTQGEAR